MGINMRLLLLAIALLFVGVGTASAADRSSPGNQDDWRYVYYNDEWWYWLPEGRWLFWRDGRWNSYAPDSFTLCPTVVPWSYGWPAWYGVGVGPFYERAYGSYYGYGGEESEIGPFYGRPFPRGPFWW
ncbi:MAG: hypothetical protein LLG00_03285 [Planctomycetaceae bacterium]|nr:hypothetical protein [Planctomycetaceae bacterium]